MTIGSAATGGGGGSGNGVVGGDGGLEFAKARGTTSGDAHAISVSGFAGGGGGGGTFGATLPRPGIGGNAISSSTGVAAGNSGVRIRDWAPVLV